MMLMQSEVGEIAVKGEFGTSWKLAYSTETPEADVQLIHLKLSSESEQFPPHTKLCWEIPQLDIQLRWFPGSNFQHYVPADWGGPAKSNLASQSPIMSLAGDSEINRLTFSCSEAMRNVKIFAGVREENNRIACSVELFSEPEAPMKSYETVLRLDRRPIRFHETVSAASAWLSSFPEYKPQTPPETAFLPFYSTWYSYHQDVFDKTIEAECAEAVKLGMKGLLVDDGWQTDDNNRGYAFCGDWEISKKRFPDMRAHVANIHQLGMKYVVWFSVPFVGFKSKACKRFEGKYLYKIDRLSTYVLDPRFPEVREYLIRIYENAVKDWDLDGFKLDFIDSFRFEGEDPALKDNYAGRDIKTVPAAVDRLLSDIVSRLSALKKDLLFEFRQSYIGPAIRKYGNMFRAADCPADTYSNRLRTIDLRMTSGNTAVHSDMLEWNTAESVENAALQILNILFSVPQISVRLNEISAEHKKMLAFWMAFMTEHRELLQNGKLTPFRCQENYPLVVTEKSGETLIAVYGRGQCVPVAGEGVVYLVNASGCDTLVMDCAKAPSSVQAFDVCGEPVSVSSGNAGLCRIAVPRSGLLKMTF